MEYIIKYLGSGQIYKYPKNPAVNITIVNFSDITNTIIPFFNKNPLPTAAIVMVMMATVGVKLFDYIDWCKIAKLMNDGTHLTLDGLNLIRTIKSGMNTGRNITNI